jgi:folate-binding protein YgfZ
LGGSPTQEAHSVQPGAHGGWVVRLPDVLGAVRSLWVGPREASDGLLGALPSLPAQVWPWLEVMSGVARIQLPTVDQFVPQMINFEVIGGVNFKKGCYPGQEIVARSQYRGTLKRRLHLAHCDALGSVGQEVFSADDPGQPAGLVANSAAIPGGQGCSVLMELKLAHAGSALSLGGADGPSLRVDALPYEIPPQDA